MGIHFGSIMSFHFGGNTGVPSHFGVAWESILGAS